MLIKEALLIKFKRVTDLKKLHTRITYQKQKNVSLIKLLTYKNLLLNEQCQTCHGPINLLLMETSYIQSDYWRTQSKYIPTCKGIH